jgi:NADH:ubiquinone oxidoreductase subunit 4 (subunit M)
MKLSSLHVNEKLRQEKEVKNVFKQVFWLATMECRQFAVVLVFVVALLFFGIFPSLISVSVPLSHPRCRQLKKKS